MYIINPMSAIFDLVYVSTYATTAICAFLWLEARNEGEGGTLVRACGFREVRCEQ